MKQNRVSKKSDEVIRSGKIGKVIFFRAVVVNHIDKESKWYKTPWRTVSADVSDGPRCYVRLIKVPV